MSTDQIAVAPRPFWRTPLFFVILCGCLIGLLSFGPRSALGLFQLPIIETRGWSREIFALALAIQNLLWGAGQPVAGALADRYGSARVLIGGGLIYAAGIALTAWAPTPLWLHLTAGVMMGVGMSAASFSIVLAALGKRVPPSKRSLIFGISTASGSLGQFLFAPLGQALIADYGWQPALLIMAIMMLAIPFLALALRGRPDSAAAGEVIAEQTMTAALREAFAHRSYVLLVIGFFVCGFHVAFITAHLPAYIEDIGVDMVYAGWALAMIGLFNFGGSLAAGFLGERYSKPYLLTFIYLARAVAFAAFVSLPASPASVLVFSAVIGLLWLSTVPPTSALVAIMFGPKYMATLMGVVFFNHQLGAFIGVWLGGYLYDRTGTYDVVWWLGVALGLLAAIVHWPIREASARPALAAAGSA